MNEIIKILQQEIQSIKMKLSAQIEENVRLKGFKQIVMDAPKKFAEKIDYKKKFITIFFNKLFETTIHSFLNNICIIFILKSS